MCEQQWTFPTLHFHDRRRALHFMFTPVFEWSQESLHQALGIHIRLGTPMLLPPSFSSTVEPRQDNAVQKVFNYRNHCDLDEDKPVHCSIEIHFNLPQTSKAERVGHCWGMRSPSRLTTPHCNFSSTVQLNLGRREGIEMPDYVSYVEHHRYVM